MANIEKMLEQVLEEGYLECPDCFENMDPDQEICSCGYKNELRIGGFI